MRLDGPMPGESLTATPKNAPYERPPEITDASEAIEMHLSRLEDPDRMNKILDVLEFSPMTLYQAVKGMMRSAVANGIHSVDVGLIAAPVVHEYIKQVAETAGVPYKEGLGVEESREAAQKTRVTMQAKKMLEEMDMVPEGFERDSVVNEEEIKQTAKGLMARPDKEEI